MYFVVLRFFQMRQRNYEQVEKVDIYGSVNYISNGM